MTNHEAIQFLNNMIGEEHGRSIGADGFYRELCAYHVDALKMAIKALEQEPIYYPPCIDCNKKMDEIRRAYDKLKEQEPCEDAISRQAVLDLVYADWKYEGLESDIENLPPVNSQPKTGHWKQISPARIYECDICGQNVMTDDISAYRYCHGCGTKMVEPQESEED